MRALLSDSNAIPPMLRSLVLAVLVALALVSAVQASRKALTFWGSGDFGVPLLAAKLLEQENVYQRYHVAPLPMDDGRGPDANPRSIEPVQVPSVLILFWPFTLLPWPTARMAWLAMNMLFTAGVVMLGFRRFLPGRPVALALAVGSLLILSVSWRNLIANGQHLLSGLFFFLAAAELADRRRSGSAGLVLALALVKYSTILFLLPWLLFRRQWVPVAVAIGVHGLLTAAIAVHLGENPVTLIVQSFGVAAELETQGYIDLFALTGEAGLAAGWAAAGAALLFAVVLGAAWRSAGREDDLALALLGLVSAVLVYHRAYDLVVLVIPLLIAIERWPRDRSLALIVFATMALAWFVGAGRGRIDWLDGKGAYHYLVVALWYGTLALFVVRGYRREDRPAPWQAAGAEGVAL